VTTDPLGLWRRAISERLVALAQSSGRSAAAGPASFLEAGRLGRATLATYALGLGLVALAYIVVSIAATAILFAAAGEVADPSTLPALPIGPAGPAATLGLLLIPSAVVVAAVASVARGVHARPASTLVRAERPLRWRRALVAGGVWTGSAATFELVAYLLYPSSYSWRFDPARFVPLLVVAVLLVPLQSAAEELFFRGYLMQGLAVATRRGWTALVASSIAFALVHAGNPELVRFGRWFLLYYAGVGLGLGLAAILDDGLEVAIGAHTANNLWGALVASFPGSVLDTPALLRVDGVPPAATAALGAAAALTSLLALGTLYRWRSRWRALGPLPIEPIEPPAPPAPAVAEVGQGGPPAAG
jgi:hypothetical protein